MEAVDTGEPIKVPVGKEVLGRMFNVIGETIDEKGPVETELQSSLYTERRLRLKNRIRQLRYSRPASR